MVRNLKGDVPSLDGLQTQGLFHDQVSLSRRTSSITAALKRPAIDIEFEDAAESRNTTNRAYQYEDVFEDDDDDKDWEDSDDSATGISDNQLMFQRVDPTLNLDSRRSIITTLISQRDRPRTWQASRSQSILPQPRDLSPSILSDEMLGWLNSENVSVYGDVEELFQWHRLRLPSRRLTLEHYT